MVTNPIEGKNFREVIEVPEMETSYHILVDLSCKLTDMNAYGNESEYEKQGQRQKGEAKNQGSSEIRGLTDPHTLGIQILALNMIGTGGKQDNINEQIDKVTEVYSTEKEDKTKDQTLTQNTQAWKAGKKELEQRA